MSLLQAQSALGLLLLPALAWALGGFRRGVRPRVIPAGIGLQIVLAAILLNVPPVRATFFLLGDAVDALATATRAVSVAAMVVGVPPCAMIKPSRSAFRSKTRWAGCR